jgi:Reverse transcriptase (RNA-dependent DNA polymerase)
MVVDLEFTPLLGLKDCNNLGLINYVQEMETRPNLGSKESVMDSHKNLFEGLGCMPGDCTITLQADHFPVIHPPRRIPVSLKDKLNDTLLSLEEKGVIQRVAKPTNWVNNLVIIEKPNGSLRLCIDPVDLNKAIQREHYPIPNAQDVTDNLSGMTIFSILDMKEGFYQISLDEPSSDLCTFNSPMGRFKFLRMPFGIKSAPEIFQRRNTDIFGDIPGVQIIYDDLIIAGKTVEEHDKALLEVFKRANESNIRFNPDKFQYRIKEVKYMGHVVSAQGLKTDRERVKAIDAFPTPTNVTF